MFFTLFCQNNFLVLLATKPFALLPVQLFCAVDCASLVRFVDKTNFTIE